MKIKQLIEEFLQGEPVEIIETGDDRVYFAVYDVSGERVDVTYFDGQPKEITIAGKTFNAEGEMIR